MDREKWRELASDYIEGNLPRAAQEAIEAHLRENEESRVEEAQLRGLLASLSELPEVEPPLFFADNVMARLAREQEAKKPWWSSLGRLAYVTGGSITIAGAAAALLWTIFVPAEPRVKQADVRPMRALPGAAGPRTPGTPLSTPRLGVERSLWLTPQEPPAFDFALTLENAERGTVRVTLPGDPQVYRGVFTPESYPLLRIPLSAARHTETMLVRCDWSAGGQTHVKHLAVPLPDHDRGTLERRMSFGLADLSLPEAARALVARYNVPITLEDVPDGLSLAIVARNETLEETLRRHLAGRGLKVSASSAGVVVEPEIPTR